MGKSIEILVKDNKPYISAEDVIRLLKESKREFKQDIKKAKATAMQMMLDKDPDLDIRQAKRIHNRIEDGEMFVCDSLIESFIAFRDGAVDQINDMSTLR